MDSVSILSLLLLHGIATLRREERVCISVGDQIFWHLLKQNPPTSMPSIQLGIGPSKQLVEVDKKRKSQKKKEKEGLNFGSIGIWFTKKCCWRFTETTSYSFCAWKIATFLDLDILLQFCCKIKELVLVVLWKLLRLGQAPPPPLLKLRWYIFKVHKLQNCQNIHSRK